MAQDYTPAGALRPDYMQARRRDLGVRVVEKLSVGGLACFTSVGEKLPVMLEVFEPRSSQNDMLRYAFGELARRWDETNA